MVLQSLILATLLTGGIQGTPPQESPIPSESFRKEVAFDWLKKQCDLGFRYPGSEGHLKCRDLILEETKKHCENARLQPFSHKWTSDKKTYSMWNVIGEQNWKDAKVRIALFAHWDTRPTADMERTAANRKKPILGANDGASGVAVLLELMRVTKNAPKDLGILYVFVDGEDLGPELDEMFLGARHFAKNMPTPRPDYGILLDMIGDKDLKVPVEPNSYRYASKVVNAVYGHARTVGLASTFPYTFGPEIEDDHIPLNEAGLPTIDLIDFDYEPWHTLGDTPDKCSPDSLGKVGRLLETWLLKPNPQKP